MSFTKFPKSECWVSRGWSWKSVRKQRTWCPRTNGVHSSQRVLPGEAKRSTQVLLCPLTQERCPVPGAMETIKNPIANADAGGGGAAEGPAAVGPGSGQRARSRPPQPDPEEEMEEDTVPMGPERRAECPRGMGPGPGQGSALEHGTTVLCQQRGFPSIAEGLQTAAGRFLIHVLRSKCLFSTNSKNKDHQVPGLCVQWVCVRL